MKYALYALLILLAAATWTLRDVVVALFPEDVTLAQRLATFDAMPPPAFDGEVEIRWNDHLVPYIVAEKDIDGAMALGLVHAHLRLGQMEVYKRVARGRISEMAGPLTTDIDAAIRALGFDRAVPDMLAAMPQSSRDWLAAYVRGINHYKTHVTARPQEYGLLGIEEEPWTMEDSLAISRVGGSDVTWFFLPRLLALRGSDKWDVLWRRLGSLDAPDPAAPVQADGDGGPMALLGEIAMLLGRSGSNSIAVAPERSATGGALVANDPHLGLTLPNAWLIAGLRSPTYQRVGLMVPGYPVFALGRTPHLSWGGTNLRSWSTDLVDLGDGAKTAETERHTIVNRFWFDTEAVNRLSAVGPVLSDVDAIEFPEGVTVAARWTGHLASDELTAMLGVMRARRGAELRPLMEGFSLPAQNILYGDANGQIGKFVSTWLPARPVDYPADIFQSRVDSDAAWERILTTADLPHVEDPEHGYLVSANDRAFPAPPTRIGLVFSPKQRVDRLAELITAKPKLTVHDLMRMQQDTLSASALAMARAVTAAVPDNGGEPLRLLRGWDGRFDADSRGALAYEAVLVDLAPKVFKASGLPEALGLWRGSGHLDGRTRELFVALPQETQSELAQAALAEAKATVATGDAWGDRHVGVVRHLLSMVPILGERFVKYTYPGSGGRETVMKSGSEFTAEIHNPGYGSQSRHVSDMAHPDANYFVLFGGQDSWFASPAFADQVELWRKGRYIRMPLTSGLVKRAFPHSKAFAATH